MRKNSAVNFTKTIRIHSPTFIPTLSFPNVEKKIENAFLFIPAITYSHN